MDIKKKCKEDPRFKKFLEDKFPEVAQAVEKGTDIPIPKGGQF